MIAYDISFDILRLLETPGVGISRVWAVLDYANSRNIKIEEVLREEKALQEVLTKAQVDYFSSNLNAVKDIWNQLHDRNISLLAVTDKEYPHRLRIHLGKKAPPLLAVLGNKSLLNKTSVGFCGSRKASNKGLATASDCADQLATKGVNVVSGYAAGVDMATHKAALDSGGTTTIVLAEGILKFKVKRDLQDVWDWQKTVVVSEFLPGIPWSIHNAMKRNQTICALSNAMILIEAGETGGSIEAGRTCLGMGLPLFAAVYEGMPETAKGNQELLNYGARPLLKSLKNNRAKIETVLSVLFEERNGHRKQLNIDFGG